MRRRDLFGLVEGRSAVLARCSKVLLLTSLATLPFQLAASSQSRSRPDRFGVRSMVFSPDENRLAVVKGHLAETEAFSNEVQVWNVATGSLERTFNAFGGPVVSVAFSPAGSTLVTASWEQAQPGPRFEGSNEGNRAGLVKVWDIDSGELLWVRRAHTSNVGPVAVSPDGKSIATSGLRPSLNFLSGEVKLWQADSGNLIREIVYRAPVTAIAFSPEGDRLAVRKFIYSELRSEIKLYDAKSLKELRTLKESRKRAVRFWRRALRNATAEWGLMVFSTDGKALAAGVEGETGGLRSSDLQIWDVQSGKIVQALRGPSRTVIAAAFSPDGGVLTAATAGVVAHAWNVGTGRGLWSGRTTRPAASIALSGGSSMLAVADFDEAIRIWDLSTGQLRISLAGAGAASGTLSVEPLIVSAARVLSVAFAEDGKTLVAGSDSGSLKLWDVAAGVEKSRLTAHEKAVSSVAFVESATVISGGSDGTIRVSRLDGNDPDRTINCQGPVTSIAVSPDGTLAACAAMDKRVELWDIKSASLRLMFSGHSDSVLAVAFSPDGKTLASGSADRTVKLWDVGTGEISQTLSDYSGPVRALAFDPGWNTLAASDGRTVKLWDVGTGALKLILKGHEGEISCLAFSPAPFVLASGSEDKTVRLWDLRTGKTMKTLKGHDIGVYSISFSPDGKTAAVASGNDSVILWETETGRMKRVLKEAASLPVRRR